MSGDAMVIGASEGGENSPRSRLGKKHLHPSNEYQSWDYLKGSGPAAPDANHPDHKPRFKPGWKTRKKEKDINPWSERVAFEEGKAKVYEKYQEHKKAELLKRSSKYNPISGEFMNNSGNWEPASDPWAHIQSGKKLVQPSASSQEKKQRKAKGQVVRAQLRQDRIVTEGLFATKKGDCVGHVFGTAD
ncbi:hypothetical protein HOP50_17g79500 [Chloropicon primus]|uniref:Uncharacterized protein n=1 Tax=Chloropicon primus TaxID=1764295 RepID=A0A5B8MXT6_9CHLO|nr:hypothetical protein A3770_17p79270 [Chloropicon primus]UPR04606.1 hypothetical protein HOP50_17g79500 [Chloropicon primus]|eukprot:QDZ25409.1 hypothetical protein A3770_17p79270 [Chloropicon primus]